MRQIIWLLCFLVGLGTITAQNYNRISKDILKCHRQMIKNSIRNEQYFELRKQIKVLEKLHNKEECDTIFLLELHAELADPFLYLLIWNQSDTLYIYAKDDLSRKEYRDERVDTFSKYMCYLVSKWDYEELKKEGKLYPAGVVVENVFATRIILNKRRYSIDCMSFKAFFKFDRDYIYRPYIKKDD